QRSLKLVDDQRARRVHRPQADQPFAHVEATDKIHDPVGEIDELDTLVRLDDEGFAMNRKAARRRRSHLLDGPLADGDGRTFAHAVSCPIAHRGIQVHRLALSWVSVRASFLVRTCNVTKKRILEQPPGRQDGRPSRLCYTRVVSALAGSNVAIRFRRFTRASAVHAKWVKCPHGPATVSGARFTPS